MVFDRLFKNFKKDKPADDYGNMTVHDLTVGCFFDYDLTTWEVKEEYEYDWGDEEFSREFKITNGKDTRFLSIDDGDELELIVSEKIKLRSIDATLYSYLVSSKDPKPPSKITYDGKTFFMDEEAPGLFFDLSEDNEDGTEFISWTYYDENEAYSITIEQWEETSFDASYGKVIKEYHISNLLPSANS